MSLFRDRVCLKVGQPRSVRQRVRTGAEIQVKTLFKFEVGGGFPDRRRNSPPLLIFPKITIITEKFVLDLIFLKEFLIILYYVIRDKKKGQVVCSMFKIEGGVYLFNYTWYWGKRPYKKKI